MYLLKYSTQLISPCCPLPEESFCFFASPWANLFDYLAIYQLNGIKIFWVFVAINWERCSVSCHSVITERIRVTSNGLNGFELLGHHVNYWNYSSVWNEAFGLNRFNVHRNMTHFGGIFHIFLMYLQRYSSLNGIQSSMKGAYLCLASHTVMLSRAERFNAPKFRMTWLEGNFFSLDLWHYTVQPSSNNTQSHPVKNKHVAWIEHK